MKFFLTGNHKLLELLHRYFHTKFYVLSIFMLYQRLTRINICVQYFKTVFNKILSYCKPAYTRVRAEPEFVNV